MNVMSVNDTEEVNPSKRVILLIPLFKYPGGDNCGSPAEDFEALRTSMMFKIGCNPTWNRVAFSLNEFLSMLTLE